MPLLVVITVYVVSIPSAGSVVPEEYDADTLSKIRGCINNVLVSKYDHLNELCDTSLKMLADKLYASGLISQPALNPSSIDKIIREFKSALPFKETLRDIEEHCNKFLKAFTDIGGSYAAAAVVLAREFKQRCKSEVDVELHITC